mgnify:CR=1 FL=1
MEADLNDGFTFLTFFMSYSKSEAGEGKGVERGKQRGFAITRSTRGHLFFIPLPRPCPKFNVASAFPLAQASSKSSCACATSFGPPCLSVYMSPSSGAACALVHCIHVRLHMYVYILGEFKTL